MHPDDKRNLIIFFAICLAAFFAYDIFIHKPKMKALEAHRATVAAQPAEAPVNAAAETQAQSVEDGLQAGARIAIDNPDLSGSLSLRGGRIDDLSLRQYFETVERETPVRLMEPASGGHPLYADFGWLGENGVATPNAQTQWRARDGGPLSKDKPVTLTWSNGQGLNFERTYSMDEHYMFTVEQRVTNTSGRAVVLHPYASLTRQGLPADFVKNAIMHEGPIGFFDGELKETSYGDLDDEPRHDFGAGKGWAGFTDKYWFSGIIPAGDAQKTFRFIRAEKDGKGIYQVDMTGAGVTVEPGASATDQIHAYVGPKKLEVLSGYEEKLGIERFDLVIDFGMFWFLTIPFFHILTFLGTTFGSFAVAILVFTVILRLAVFPLANKSYRSFAKMRKIQPKMLEVRERYGEDRAKLQQAIFELYKKEQVNPMAGCLPLLIQIPIFFALYKVLYISLDMRHAPFWGWINDMSAPDPLTVFNLFGLIPWTPPSMLMIGPWALMMGLTLFMQQRMNPPAQDAMQAKILSFMPIIITFLMAHFPAGLVIYWTWSNCLSILQQYVLMKQEGVEVHFFRKDPADKKMEDVVAHQPTVHPGLDAIEHEAKEVEEKVEKAISPPKPKKKR